MRTWMLSILLILAGCEELAGDDKGDTETPGVGDVDPTADDDADGFAAAVDCDDEDANVHPDADESCDGIDNNCDGNIDGADADGALTFFEDKDLDGFGMAGETLVACSKPEGFATVAGDCDDVNATINPDANEVCNGADDNCSGAADDSVDDTWYADLDGDGFGDAATTEKRCDGTSQWVADATDCNDGDGAINPAATELCDAIDNNCDGDMDDDDPGVVATDTFFLDTDGDGYGVVESTITACTMPAGYAANSGDCNESDINVSPGAAEMCGDSIDNDCNGDADEAASIDAGIWFRDFDADGFGDSAATGIRSCTAITGYAENDADCDDDNPALYDTTIWFLDADGDGYGVPSATVYQNGCTVELNRALNDDDCNDADENIFAPVDWYLDTDGDGFGDRDDLSPINSCDAQAGRVADNLDCDDTEGGIRPDMFWFMDSDGDGDGSGPGWQSGSCDTPGLGWSRYNGDCDDANASLTQWTEWFEDNDVDTYGDADGTPVVQCDDPGGVYVMNSSDCDDSTALISPETLWYLDADEDGYGGVTQWMVDAAPGESCTQPDNDETTGKPFVANTDDCDDDDNNINPDTQWFGDADGDGDGDVALPFGVASCTNPDELAVPSWVANSADCDDSDSALFSGTVWYEDLDGDGTGSGVTFESTQCTMPGGLWSVLTGDSCDNTNGQLAPRSRYTDGDNDGFGDPNDLSPVSDCDAVSGRIDNNIDCDDSTDTIRDGTDYWPDADSDGSGDFSADPVRECTQSDLSTVTNNDDCDDDDGGVQMLSWYTDVDDDGDGDEADVSPVMQCDEPVGYAATNTDCNDLDADIFAGATELCDGKDNDCDTNGDPADAWFASEFEYRMPLQVTGSSAAVPGAPISVPMDFRALLDGKGDATTFDPDSVRVVYADCGGDGMFELPSQFYAGDRDPLTGAPIANAGLEGAGSVVFAYDTDGDPNTAESFAGAGTYNVEIYFQGSETAGSYADGVTFDSENGILSTGEADYTFDTNRGGLISAFNLEGGVDLGEMDEFGNGANTASGWMSVGAETATVHEIEGGAVMGFSRSSGNIANDDGAFDWTYEFFTFAGRPEVYVHTVFETTAALDVFHSGTAASGVRPIQIEHTAVLPNAGKTTDGVNFEWSDRSEASGVGVGVAVGYIVPPSEIGTVYNGSLYQILYGSESVLVAGAETQTIPDATTFVDSVAVIMPHDNDYTFIEDEFQAVRAGFAQVASGAESVGEFMAP